MERNRDKDCIVIFSHHIIQKRTGTRNAEECIIENGMEGIWDDLKPEVTADKNNQEIKRLREETKEMRRKLHENKRAMNIMLVKVTKVKESSSDK